MQCGDLVRNFYFVSFSQQEMLGEMFWSSKEMDHAAWDGSPFMIPKALVQGSAQGRMPEKEYEITSQQNPLAWITDIFDLNSNLKHAWWEVREGIQEGLGSSQPGVSANLLFWR